MRRNFAILAATGLALATLFAVPATARADTTHGCDYIKAIGNETIGGLSDGDAGELLFDGNEAAIIFCNVGISINGEFEIATENSSGHVTGCLAMNATSYDVDVDPASACALNGGAGYPWDRWNAISIEYHGNQLWEFETDNTDYTDTCMEENSGDGASQFDFCDASNHYQWFQWQDANL